MNSVYRPRLRAVFCSTNSPRIHSGDFGYDAALNLDIALYTLLYARHLSLVRTASEAFMGAAAVGVWAGVDGAVYGDRDLVWRSVYDCCGEQYAVCRRTPVYPQSRLQLRLYADPVWLAQQPPCRNRCRTRMGHTHLGMHRHLPIFALGSLCQHRILPLGDVCKRIADHDCVFK